MFPPRTQDTIDKIVPTSPSGPSTRPSRSGGAPTPDSLLGIGGGEQRLVRDSIRARLFPGAASAGDALPVLDEPILPKIGRYAVVRRIGEGGMGIVFAAYDEELDRKVAIKLLRGHHRSDERSRTRLWREAQALARLSHPHVVQIHEVGEWQREVFIVMEFVPGQTLRQWITRPRPWASVLDVLVQAGRGLAAAHAVGLVHRDFKPDNVMVAEDGRARVLDFGLVRASEDLFESHGDESEADPSPADPWAKPFAVPLTRAGSVLGTPIYMAPEQHVGEPADPLGDQFSFCATAFEVLFGVRPFASESLIGLIEAARNGTIRAIPKDSPIPRRVREAILRGLAPQASARWPSMAALLAELDAARGRRARPWALLAAAGVGAIVAGTLAFAWPRPELGSSCAAIDADALAGTWDASRREALHVAIASTELAHASSTAAAIERTLDTWAGEWVATQRRACEATHEQGVQSTIVLDHQQACLRGQARRVAGLLDVLATPDAALLERVGELLDRLPEPSRCLSSAGSTEVARTELELDPRVVALEPELAAVEGLIVVGKREPAATRLAELTRAAAGLDDPSLRLRVAALELELAWARNFDPAVVERWRDLAGEARLAGLDELEVDLRVRLAIVVDANLPDRTLDEWLIADAQLALAGRDERGSRRAALVELERLRTLARAGEHTRAEAGYTALLAEVEAHAWTDLAGRVQVNLAHLDADAGRHDAATRRFEQARADLVAVWGPEHPSVAAIDHDLALLAMDTGELERAEALLDRAQTIHASNPGSLALADDRHARAALALYSGNLEGARELADAALEAYARELGPNHEQTLRATELRGILRYFEGDLAGSLADYDRVLPYYASVSADAVSLALLHVNRGDTLLALDRPAEALVEFDRAHERLEAAAPTHVAIASALAGRGEARLALGEPEAAIVLLERALATLEPGELTERAEARFALARALAAVGREPDRVAELIDQARATFVDLGLTTRLETLDRWRGR